MKSPALSLCAVFASLSLICSPASQADTVVLNTIDGNTSEGSLSVSDNAPLAEQFMTGVDPLQLSHLTLSIGGVSGAAPTAQIDLYAQGQDLVSVKKWYAVGDGSYKYNLVESTNWLAPTPIGSPIYSGAAPTANQLWNIDVAGAYNLDPNTKYWIVFTVTGGSIDWNYTSGLLPIGQDQYLANAAWDSTQPGYVGENNLYPDSPLMVKIEAAPVPEPGTIGLSILGIGMALGWRRLRQAK